MMSADNEDCDIGLLEAFLRAEGDESVPPPAGPAESEKKEVGPATTLPALVQSSTIGAAVSVRGSSNTDTSVKSTMVSKAMPEVANQLKKKQFSKQFVKERESHLMHKGDTDSSDDEDNKYFEEQNYSEYGRNVKHLLNMSTDTSTEGTKQQMNFGASWKRPQPHASTSLSECVPGQAGARLKPTSLAEIDEDPVFGIRMVNPLISSTTLKERMVGRQVISLANLKRHLLREDTSSDWVIGGVIISKSGTRTSQKGAEYSIWRISDLKAGLKTASVFLFGKSFKDHWKTSVGTVVGILNPKPLENRDGSGDEATMSVDNPQKLMIMGTSKDFGMCKARKKNGENCTSFVNMNQCEYCVYHLQKAYKSCSRRMELQSPCAGRGLNKLRNKVLGKNEVFYGGQSYMAVPAKKSSKLISKDDERLKKLSDFYKPDIASTLPHGRSNKENKTRSKFISTLHERNSDQAKRDEERLRKLCNAPLQTSTKNSDLNESVTNVEKVQTKLVVQNRVTAVSPSPTAVIGIEVPQLGRGVMDSGIVDLTPPRTVHHERAKLNALKWIHKHGPIRKEDPNKIPGADKNKIKTKREGEANNCASKYIKLDTCNTITPSTAGKNTVSPPSKPGVNSRFQKLLEATSRHMELVEARDNEAQEEYFDKLEKKEKLEDKMLSTYKVPCKAVKCLKCKYTAFSASDKCKAEGHPLRVTDGVKRFFKCCNCGNRTATLELIPLWSCRNCASSHWERAPMLKERKIGLTAALSIRGDEEKNIGSVESCANLNLLVPE